MKLNFNVKNIKLSCISLICFYSALLNSGASQATVQNFAPFTTSYYSNSLLNQESVGSDFLDFSNLRAETYGYEIKFQDATFTANTNWGLGLTSQTYYIAQGVKVLDKSFSVSRDWQVSVKAHISNIGNSLPNPSYYSAITIGKIAASYGESLGNHLNLNFTRSKTGSNLTNTINTGMYISGNGITDVDDDINSEDLYLKVSYHSENKTCYLSYSYDGEYYNIIKSYNLQQSWSLAASDEIYIALVCTYKPFTDLCEYHENNTLVYNLNVGELHLSNLEISMPVVNGSNTNQQSVVESAPVMSGSALEKSRKNEKKSSAKKSSSRSLNKSTVKKSSSSKKSSASKSSSSKKSSGKKKKK